MTKILILTSILMLFTPALAHDWSGKDGYGFATPSYGYGQPTCQYTPRVQLAPMQNYENYGANNQYVTRSEYPGALDPVRNLPAWSYNP